MPTHTHARLYSFLFLHQIESRVRKPRQMKLSQFRVNWREFGGWMSRLRVGGWSASTLSLERVRVCCKWLILVTAKQHHRPPVSDFSRITTIMSLWARQHTLGTGFFCTDKDTEHDQKPEPNEASEEIYLIPR